MLNRFINLLMGLVLITALALYGCASRKPHATRPPKSEPITRADSTGRPPAGVVVQPPRTLLDKLTGRTPEPQHYPPGTPVVVKGKKNTLTINQVAGSQSNSTTGKKATSATGNGATASVIEKKAGPAQVASDSSTQNALLGGGNLANVPGDGNTLPQTKQDTTTEAPGVGATIAKALTGPLGYVLAIAAAGGLVFLVIRRRAKKAAENLV